MGLETISLRLRVIVSQGFSFISGQQFDCVPQSHGTSLYYERGDRQHRESLLMLGLSFSLSLFMQKTLSACYTFEHLRITTRLIHKVNFSVLPKKMIRKIWMLNTGFDIL